jgi:hypothetical protein
MERYEFDLRRGRRLRTVLLRAVASGTLLTLVALLGTLVFEPDALRGRLPVLGAIALMAAVVQVGLYTGDKHESLVIERTGIRLRGVEVPWSSIDRLDLILWNGAAVSEPRHELGIRLRDPAPLPVGVKAVVYDPGALDASHVRFLIPARAIETERLHAAVRVMAHSPVRVVTGPPAEAPIPWRASGSSADTFALVTDIRLRDHAWSSRRYSYRPHLVVAFALADGRRIVAESENPGSARLGQQVLVSYDLDDPTRVRVHTGSPKPIRPIFGYPHVPYRGRRP